MPDVSMVITPAEGDHPVGLPVLDAPTKRRIMQVIVHLLTHGECDYSFTLPVSLAVENRLWHVSEQIFHSSRRYSLWRVWTDEWQVEYRTLSYDLVDFFVGRSHDSGAFWFSGDRRVMEMDASLLVLIYGKRF